MISVAGCLLKTGEPSGNETHTIDILYNDIPVAAHVLEFHVDTPQQSLLVAAARLIYKRFEYNTGGDEKGGVYAGRGDTCGV
ncbi:MAG TPA: hypothetical protein VLI68_15910 [Hanamia sp.]|nr:hypothetical protein [Hanamia sp.]